MSAKWIVQVYHLSHRVVTRIKWDTKHPKSCNLDCYGSTTKASSKRDPRVFLNIYWRKFSGFSLSFCPSRNVNSQSYYQIPFPCTRRSILTVYQRWENDVQDAQKERSMNIVIWTVKRAGKNEITLNEQILRLKKNTETVILRLSSEWIGKWAFQVSLHLPPQSWMGSFGEC